MDISIIIVNYNVKHFLEQCLCSLQRAIDGLAAEVLVIDNNSTDNSLAYLQPRFPGVRFIANTENAGFGKACNQGLKMATGRKILFLNPDTILPEDAIRKCIRFLDSHPDAGALGIKMIDGSGRFLRESKRSFPSPITSLYKLFGLARLFPHSSVFSRYHLGHLDENQNHEVDVLAGAFMMIRREVLEKTGGFDEIFFMYGEDVDLSYRIQKAGYVNYYFADSQVIHFKGESTKRGSMNYVRMFYTAMSVFVRKHYGGSRAGVFSFLIHVAIWIRAAMTAIGGFIRRIGLPLIDAGLILVSFWVMKNIWNGYVKTTTQYEHKLLWTAFPAFTIMYLVTAYYAGLYDRWYKRSELVSSTLVATVVLLVGYSLLPERYRFSRGILVFGAFLAFILIGLLRWVLVGIGVLGSSKEKEGHADTLIVGSPPEYEEAMKLMEDAGMKEKILGRVATSPEDTTGIGYWSRLEMLIRSIALREAIFCQGSLSFKDIVEYVPQLRGRVKIKIHAVKSGSIVGSDSRNTSGEALSHENGYRLSDPYQRRLKRLLDVCIAGGGLITFPLQLILIRRPLHFFGDCFQVLSGRKTWVGYAAQEKNLPPLRRPVLTCQGTPFSMQSELPPQSLQRMDYWYARDYEPGKDIRLIWKNYRRLGG